MSKEALFAGLKKLSGRVTFLPAAHAHHYQISDGAGRAYVHADQCIVCSSSAAEPTERLVLNVFKVREPVKYPWKKNCYLSHSRKVRALRAWRSNQSTWCRMVVPQALGRVLRIKTQPARTEDALEQAQP